jgi:hypothetical protein
MARKEVTPTIKETSDKVHRPTGRSVMNQSNNLIQCADHKWAPWSVVCVHLINGETDWNPVPNEMPEVDYDWLCTDCRSKHPDLELDDLKAICIHCVRELQARAGVDPDSFEPILGSEDLV